MGADPSRAGAEAGQATAELALLLPLLVALLLVVVQVALVVRDQLALEQAAREAVRATAVSEDARAGVRAAHHVLQEVQVEVGERPPRGGQVRVDATYRSRTRVPLVGVLLPDPMLHAHAVMRVER